MTPTQKPTAHKFASKEIPQIDKVQVGMELKVLEKADEIALYYGFLPVETPSLSQTDQTFQKIIKEIEPSNKGALDEENAKCISCLEEKIALLQMYLDKDMAQFPQPVMLYYRGPILAEEKKKAVKEKSYGLEIMGIGKSIVEATLIKTAMAILKDEGFENLFVEINSMGDRDSAAKFQRELTNYYRKHMNLLPAECKQAFKKDVFELLACTHEKCLTLREQAPKSLSFLSEPSRRYFKEILEYLEMMKIPYEIRNSLIGKRFCSETVFEIKTEGNPVPLAIGMRYDQVSKRMGWKKELASAGVRISFKALLSDKPKKIISNKILKKPKFYFIQLGFDAKLKSLEVIEMLRQAKIPLYQSLSKDKLVGQLTTAENLKIPYVIIMGQKEAMENSVIVRHMNTRCQETIAISTLPKYLEKIK